jgi:hypothetical protein
MEKLKQAGSAEEQIAWIERGKLPYSAVTGAIKPSQEVWNAILYQMPTFALLRHLNTLLRSGVLADQKNLDYVVGRLVDQDALRKARILPFRFATAFRQVNEPELRDALREAVDLTFDNLPDMSGRTAIFLDISGSMQGEYLEIGSVLLWLCIRKPKGSRCSGSSTPPLRMPSLPGGTAFWDRRNRSMPVEEPIPVRRSASCWSSARRWIRSSSSPMSSRTAEARSINSSNCTARG